MDRTDERASTLFEQARAGSVPLDEMLEVYLPRLHAFVRAKMGADLKLRESSTDLVQSVCRDLIRAREDFAFQGEAEFRSWLFTAAMNKIRERARYYHRKKRDIAQQVSLGDGDSNDLLHHGYATVCTPSRVVSASEQIERLEGALGRLTDDHRDVITYYRLAGLPAAEVGKLMGRSEGAIRQLLGRALVALANELRSADDTADGPPA